MTAAPTAVAVVKSCQTFALPSCIPSNLPFIQATSVSTERSRVSIPSSRVSIPSSRVSIPSSRVSIPSNRLFYFSKLCSNDFASSSNVITVVPPIQYRYYNSTSTTIMITFQRE